MLTKFSCFLLLFTIIFLLISYLFELVLELWLSQQSNSTSKTATSASPFDFGVDQLKLILGFRGIYYLQQQHQQLSGKSLNVQQRKEKLAELVATSGQINHEELLQLRLESSTSKTDESRSSPTTAAAGRSGSLKVFASAKLMEEEIDDSHIWLLYISPNEDNEQEVVALPNVWSTLVRQFGKFDLRFARFDCKADPLYCHRRGWHRSPRLVLVFPRSRNEVGRRIYNYSLEPQTHSTDVILWLQAQLSSQLSSIDDIDAMLERGARQVTEDDNNSHSKHPQRAGLVNVVAIMGEQFRHSPPLSLSLLALRFRDRVAFGVHFAKSPDSLARLHAQLGTRLAPHLPIYLVVMHSDGGGGQLVVVYNADQPGPLSYAAMDAYLRGLTPESNDLCLVLFALANLYLGLNFFWTRCVTARRHLALCALTAVEVNLLLLLSITAVFWPLVGGGGGSGLAANYLLLSFVPEKWPLLFEQSLSLAHGSLWSSAFAFHFRAQLLSPYSTERFFVAFILSGAVLVTLRRCTPLFQQRLFGLSSSSSSYDDELIIKGVFYWASVIGCFVGFLLFRKHSRRTTARRRHHLHHHHLPGGDFHDRTEQFRASGAAQLNNGDGRPLAANTEVWPNSDEEDEELEFEEEHIDLDSDLDRLLLESMFSGMAGNLWLQPELISTDYIHQLPVWSQAVTEDQEEKDEQLSQTAVEESASSSSSSSPSSTDVSDTEESSRGDSLTVPPPHKQKLAAVSSSSKAVLTRQSQQHTSSTDAEQKSSCCSKKSPLNTKEAPQSSCCEKLADCGSSSGSSKESQKTGQQISSQLSRAKLEERKLRKIIRIRRKRGKRSSAAVVSAASTTPAISTEVQQQHQEKPADFGQLSRPEWMLDFNDCTICLEAYRGAQAIIGLACGHNYHRDCLTQWLVRGNHCCPICRWPSYRLKHPRQQQAASWRRCC